MNPKHLKTTAEHNTPREIVEAARRVLGRIDLDPMSNDAAQRVVQAETYYTAADDCFTHVWAGYTFLNPAGGLVSAAWQTLLWHYTRQYIPAFIWIGFSLEQLQTLQTQCASGTRMPNTFTMCVPSRRLRFEDGDGTPQRAPTHANYISYGGPDVRRFVREFAPWGAVWAATGQVAAPIRLVDEDPYVACT